MRFLKKGIYLKTAVLITFFEKECAGTIEGRLLSQGGYNHREYGIPISYLFEIIGDLPKCKANAQS